MIVSPQKTSKIFETYSRKIDSTEIEGYVKQSNNYAGSFTVYYVIQVNKPFDSMDAWKTDFSKNIENIYGIDWQRPRKLLQGINEIKDSSGSGIILNFKPLLMNK